MARALIVQACAVCGHEFAAARALKGPLRKTCSERCAKRLGWRNMSAAGWAAQRAQAGRGPREGK